MMVMLMNQLKAKNPNLFQMIEQARQNQSNPVELFKQITNGRSPEQMEAFYKKAEQMGFPTETINKLKG